MTALVIVQARMGSSRFPGKSLAEINGRPILWYLFQQLSFCKQAVLPVLATTNSPKDDSLAEYAKSQGWALFRGDEADVLGRYHGAALAFGAKPDTVIVRVTGDDILPDPNLIDAALSLHKAFHGLIDCVFTSPDDNLPYGVYIESYVFAALDRAFKDAHLPSDREHVTPYIRRNRGLFPALEIASSAVIKGPHLSIDTKADLALNSRIINKLETDGDKPPYALPRVLKVWEGGASPNFRMEVLETPRLKLVPCALEHAEDIFAYAKRADFAEFIDSGIAKSVDDVRVFLAGVIAEADKEQRAYWSVIDKASNKVIGTMGFIFYLSLFRAKADFGYGINPEYWGKGIFKEAASALIQYACQAMGINLFQVTTRQDNLRSIKAVENLGFVPKTVLPDYYALKSGCQNGVLLTLSQQKDGN